MIKTSPTDPMYEYHVLTGRMAAIAMEIKARKGELVFCPPVGYRINIDGPRAKAEPDPVLAPLVRRAFELYATGEYSLRSLLAKMTERGLVSRSGKPMSVASLHVMLKNPFYCGQIRWNGEVIEAGHEPLLSLEMFERTQAYLKRKNRSTK